MGRLNFRPGLRARASSHHFKVIAFSQCYGTVSCNVHTPPQPLMSSILMSKTLESLKFEFSNIRSILGSVAFTPKKPCANCMHMCPPIAPLDWWDAPTGLGTPWDKECNARNSVLTSDRNYTNTI